MAKASKKSPEEKLRVVLSVLRGELSAAAAGRRAVVSEQTVHNWVRLTSLQRGTLVRSVRARRVQRRRLCRAARRSPPSQGRPLDPLPYNVVVEFAALLASLFSAAKTAWDWLRSGRHVRVSTDEVPGPTTVEYGFSQSSVRVVVVNRGGERVEIQDIRLMFARRFGVPLMEAPPPLTHLALPAAADPGTRTMWYFPAETLAMIAREIVAEVPCEEERYKAPCASRHFRWQSLSGPRLQVLAEHQ